MGQPSNKYRPGVYKVDLKTSAGKVPPLTCRADSDLDAAHKALERAINDGWLALGEGSIRYSVTIRGPLHEAEGAQAGVALPADDDVIMDRDA